MADNQRRYVLVLTGDSESAERALKSVGASADAAGGKLTVLGQRTGASAREMKAAERELADFDKKLTMLSGVALAGVVGGLGLSAKAAIDFESSFAGVRKTVDASEAEFKELEGSFRDMAKTIPVNVNEINRIGEAAGQLGIKKEHLVGFTRTMADLGVSTNMSSDQAATALARLANITQMPQTEFDRLGSTVVALGNNLATTESEIVNMGLRIAGAGAQVGLTEAQILSFAGALSSVGIEAEAGGTAFSRVMVTMFQATKEGGEALETFAQVAGMSASQFAHAFQTDPAAAIVAFVEGLGRISQEGGNVFSVLEDLELGEIRVRDALLRSAGAGDVMRESLQLGNEAWQENAALTKEAEQRYKTTASQITIAKNNAQDLAIEVGQTLTPAIAAGAQGLAGFTRVLSEAPPSTVSLALGIAGVTAALPLAVSAGSKAITTFKALSLAWDSSAAASLRLKAGLTGVAIGLGAAMLAGDVILQKTTGHGLLEWVLGDPIRMDKATQVLREFNELVRALGPNADPAAEAAQKLTQAAEGLDIALRENINSFGSWRTWLHPTGLVATDTEVRISKAKGEVEAYARAFFDSTPAFEEFIRVQGQLEGEAKKIFLSVGNATGYIKAHSEAIARAHDENLQFAKGLPETAVGVNAVGAAAEPTSAKLLAWAETTKEAKEATQRLDEALKILTNTYGAAHPAVVALDAEIALLKEEIGDLERATSSEDKAGQKVIETKKAQLEALEGTRQGYMDEAAVIEPLLRNMDRLTGGTDAAAARNRDLVQTMADMKVPSDDMVYVLGKLNGDLTLLADGSISKAMDGFGDLKEELDPAVWAEVAKAVGPALVEAIEKGIADPQERQKLLREVSGLVGETVETGKAKANAGAEIGKAVLQGISAGLEANKNSLFGSIVTIMRGLKEAARAEIRAESPSREFADEVGEPIILGVALGIEQGRPKAEAEARKAIDGFATAVADHLRGERAREAFGEAGADVALAIRKGIEENTESGGRSAFTAIQRLIERARELGIPDAERLGQELIDAVGEAFATGTDAAKLRVEASLGQITGAMRAATEDVKLTLANFRAEMEEEAEKLALERRVGSAGARMMDALAEAIEEGGRGNIEALGRQAAAMEAQLRAKLAPEQAEAVMGEYWRALERAIVDQSPASRAELANALARMNELMRGGAIDLRTGALIAAEGIDELAKALGVKGADIIENISAINELGILPLATEIKKLPEAVRKPIAQVVEWLLKGVIDVDEAIARLMRVMPAKLGQSYEDLIAQGNATRTAMQAFNDDMTSQMGRWVQTIRDGGNMSVAELQGMFAQLRVAILQSGLPQAMVDLAIVAVNGFESSLKAGAGVANAELQAFLDGLLALAAGKLDEARRIFGEATDLLRGGSGAGGGGSTGGGGSGLPTTAPASPNPGDAFMSNGQMLWWDGQAWRNDAPSPLGDQGTGGYGWIDPNTLQPIGVHQVPQLARGTDLVERDGLAYLHRGEEVRPARVADGGYGATQPSITLGPINVTVYGDADQESTWRRMKAMFSDLIAEHLTTGAFGWGVS